MSAKKDKEKKTTDKPKEQEKPESEASKDTACSAEFSQGCIIKE